MLVDYSDSSSDGEAPSTPKDTEQRSKKRKAGEDVAPVEQRAGEPPPLPALFHSLYATSVRTSTTDDPALHAGRTRHVPHVVGNWPTHVYLEWYPSKSELAVLDHVIQKAGQLGNHTQSFLRSDLGVQLSLHISLSAPLVLKTGQRDPFQQSIGTKLSQSHVKPFAVGVTGLAWVANNDRTRFFLVLKLSKPENDELNHLLSICNTTARQFGLPQLYTDSASPPLRLRSNTEPKLADRSEAFHISIAWTLKEPDQQAQAYLVDLERDHLQSLMVSFSLLKLKIGNAVIDISLVHSRDVGNTG